MIFAFLVLLGVGIEIHLLLSKILEVADLEMQDEITKEDSIYVIGNDE